jgi:hypothetical protein
MAIGAGINKSRYERNVAHDAQSESRHHHHHLWLLQSRPFCGHRIPVDRLLGICFTSNRSPASWLRVAYLLPLPDDALSGTVHSCQIAKGKQPSGGTTGQSPPLEQGKKQPTTKYISPGGTCVRTEAFAGVIRHGLQEFVAPTTLSLLVHKRFGPLLLAIDFLAYCSGKRSLSPSRLPLDTHSPWRTAFALDILVAVSS